MSLVARIQMVKADKARAVEDLLLRLAQSNQLRNKVSEQQLIDLLGQINQQEPSASQTRIVVRCISPPQLFLCQYTKMWGVYSTIDVALMMILMMITISNWRRSKDKSHNIHIHIHIPHQSIINKAFISNTFTSFFVPRSRISFGLMSGLDGLLIIRMYYILEQKKEKERESMVEESLWWMAIYLDNKLVCVLLLCIDQRAGFATNGDMLYIGQVHTQMNNTSVCFSQSGMGLRLLNMCKCDRIVFMGTSNKTRHNVHCLFLTLPLRLKDNE